VTEGEGGGQAEVGNIKYKFDEDDQTEEDNETRYETRNYPNLRVSNCHICIHVKFGLLIRTQLNVGYKSIQKQ